MVEETVWKRNGWAEEQRYVTFCELGVGGASDQKFESGVAVQSVQHVLIVKFCNFFLGLVT